MTAAQVEVVTLGLVALCCLPTAAWWARSRSRSVGRPWGRWWVQATGPGYQVKRLQVEPGSRLSLQLHQWRAEHWVVITGTATCTVGEHELVCGPGDTATVPRGTVHRIANHGTTRLVLVEVQVGPYLGEDDIVRLDDDYGRAAGMAVSRVHDG